ncbi:unnamed protein product [Cladocopium goreaui]|uniref:Uncharacterized protein n=1 Tax=Cladocopium goreaui TaxID=2562237 RepID=A0A9P1DWK3_9DINO|nr:unnamed protein product [Cladocopium goreaui]
MPRRKFEQMPFEHDDGLDSPKRKKAKECDPKPRRTMKQKQRSWVLTGLKHLRAPAVIGMLASLVFACGGLDFSATQHFETFAGRAEGRLFEVLIHHSVVLIPKRFARALSKIRSNNKRKIRSQAKKFLKEAANTKNRMDKRPRENAHWVKHADLNPVFAYLVENGK